MDTKPRIECPFCGSDETEFFSLFGQQLLTVQYYCNGCRTPFERVKGPDVMQDAGEHVRRQDSSTEP
jgi:DNA-directed RNA polymerase subunit RPC12/RpoP